MYFDRPIEEATVSIINSFSGTATVVVLSNGTPRTFKCGWREDRPRIDEGDVVKIQPISSNWARITEVVSKKLTIEEAEGEQA